MQYYMVVSPPQTEYMALRIKGRKVLLSLISSNPVTECLFPILKTLKSSELEILVTRERIFPPGNIILPFTLKRRLHILRFLISLCGVIGLILIIKEKLVCCHTLRESLRCHSMLP